MHPFTNEEEFVGADADFSVASSAGSTLVGDKTIPNSPSDDLVGDVKVGSEVSHRTPCLRSRFEAGELCEMMPGLQPVRVEHVDMLANEAIEVDHVKEPSALRTAPGPAATDQQTRFNAPADDCAVVESEDPLDVPQAQPIHPA